MLVQCVLEVLGLELGEWALATAAARALHAACLLLCRGRWSWLLDGVILIDLVGAAVTAFLVRHCKMIADDRKPLLLRDVIGV